MALLLDINFDEHNKFGAFERELPDETIIHWQIEKDNNPDLAAVRYAVVWKPQPGLLASLANLEVIFSAGAGVDHVFEDPLLPKDKPVVRFVDPDLTSRMSEWVVLQCLMHLRQQRNYDKNQFKHHWQELDQPIASEIRVGIMGLGELGQDAAKKLQVLGFRINGWSRSRKDISNIDCYCGPDEFDDFLGISDIVVCLLPLTNKTKGILNAGLIAKLPKDGAIKPVIINAGRGGSQVEVDIVKALQSGILGGVSLDVFENEPLEKTSPLWDFNNAIITPHVAAVSSIPALARYVATQISRYESSGKLDNLVDTTRGY